MDNTFYPEVKVASCSPTHPRRIGPGDAQVAPSVESTARPASTTNFEDVEETQTTMEPGPNTTVEEISAYAKHMREQSRNFSNTLEVTPRLLDTGTLAANNRKKLELPPFNQKNIES